MLERIVELSCRNPVIVAAGMIVILLVGGRALLRTPVDAIPDLSDVQVIVLAEFPGQVESYLSGGSEEIA